MTNALPILTGVVPDDIPFTLTVAFADGAATSVDLTGAVFGFAPYAPLKNVDAFRAVSLTDDGTGIEWPAVGLDMSASTLRRLAEVQAIWSADEFKSWQRRLSLSLQETADILGRSLATVKNYRSGSSIPPAVRIACLALEHDPHLFQALYRPRRAGRPRKRSEPTASTNRPQERRNVA